MCFVLDVSVSGYYGWKKRPVSYRKVQEERLLKEIRQAHLDAKERYGTIKIWKALRSKGVQCGKHRVARIRRINCIETRRRKRFKVTTQSKYTKWIAPNVLKRTFSADQPNKAWVGDVTCIPTRSGWLYLAVLLDLYSRKVIGWSMSERNNGQLVLDAFNMAINDRQLKHGLIHHTDRGSLYGSHEYRNRLRQYGMVPSMSRRGDCWDNAVAESFFSTLKNELMLGQVFWNRDHARSEIFQFIEIFYNRQRIHQTLGYITPEAMEQQAECN
jgi:transposase InsO family protein